MKGKEVKREKKGKKARKRKRRHERVKGKRKRRESLKGGEENTNEGGRRFERVKSDRREIKKKE